MNIIKRIRLGNEGMEAMSQAQFARRHGISQSNLSKIEAGLLSPSIKMLNKMLEWSTSDIYELAEIIRYYGGNK